MGVEPATIWSEVQRDNHSAMKVLKVPNISTKDELRRNKMVSSASSANTIKKEGRQNNF